MSVTNKNNVLFYKKSSRANAAANKNQYVDENFDF